MVEESTVHRGRKTDKRQQDEEGNRRRRLIERMKEERVNRKDGALEVTEKNFMEQMKRGKRAGDENESQEKESNRGEKGGEEAERWGRTEKDIKGRRRALSYCKK